MRIFDLDERSAKTNDALTWEQLSADWKVGGLTLRGAEALSPIFACIDVISSALSALPPKLYKWSGNTRTPDTTSPIWSMIRKPNQWQTWPDFIQWVVGQVLLHGNAVVRIDRGDLEPIPWTWISIDVHDLQGGSLTYDVHAPRVSAVLSARDVLHLRDRTNDGAIGVSRISRCAPAVALMKALQDSAMETWTNSAFPSGALKVQRALKEDQRADLRRSLESQFTGQGNRGRVLLLDSSQDWQTIGINSKDSQHLESRMFSVSEACRIFEVPPPLIQDYSNNTFTNASTAGQWFSRFTLNHWARKFEAAFKQSLLPENSELELDMSAFSRGDISERWAAYKIALETGVLSPEEVKRMEGW